MQNAESTVNQTPATDTSAETPESNIERLALENIPATKMLENSVELNRAHFYLNTLSHHLSPGRLLDTCARSGVRMLGFNSHGWQVEGLEQEPDLAEVARNRFKLNVHIGNLLQFQTHRRYDLVFANNLVENSETAEARVEKIISLVARDGYVLVEHHRTATMERDNLGTRQLLARTDRLLNQTGFARVDWGRSHKETRAEHLKAALREAGKNGSISRILSLPLQWIPDNVEVRIPEFGSLWSLYQKA